ncbi:36265_t:CDS:2, partial [Gigaspora margarita]
RAIGAILSQKDEQDKERVISYASRTISMAERNYSVTEQECLAVICRKLPYGQLALWFLTLQEYDFDVLY